MSRPARIPTPFRQRLQRARLGLLPLLVWFVAVALSGKLWLMGPQAGTFHGIARAQERVLDAAFDARVVEVLVERYQEVEEGQALLAFDSASLEARIATARAELGRLAAGVEAERATLEVEHGAARAEAEARLRLAGSVASLEYPAELRAFHNQETQLQLALLEARIERSVRTLEAERLELRLGRAEGLAERSLGPLADVEDLRAALRVERTHARELGQLEERIVGELAAYGARREELEARYVETPQLLVRDARTDERLAALRAALDVQRALLAELELERGGMLLRAPMRGRIALLAVAPGQVVMAGSPLIVLTAELASEVDLWVPELAGVTPLVGDRLAVRRALAPANEAGVECYVQALSPRVEPLPQRLWRDPQRPEFGRTARIGPIDSLRLVAGERVSIDGELALRATGRP